MENFWWTKSLINFLERLKRKVYIFNHFVKKDEMTKLLQTHIGGGIGVQTPVMMSDITISTFLSIELRFVDIINFKLIKKVS